ncbi:hypothetical protein SLEP1_g41084 [Rubroshorea leprosula]|uniref:Uncharacterized protein n=1 Tax=Rubroshorea leprosula TaxID=152421 RepID=A0AAV5L5H4_9ROSI|nr:hypothetical protein SLEP1_g41084 [Rubroshorea leprosula]
MSQTGYDLKYTPFWVHSFKNFNCGTVNHALLVCCLLLTLGSGKNHVATVALALRQLQKFLLIVTVFPFIVNPCCSTSDLLSKMSTVDMK